MDATRWKQVNIAYPGQDPCERERNAVGHLARVMPAAEADGLIESWFFIRKGRWRVRYLPTEKTDGITGHDRLRPLLTNGVPWSGDIYEPEVNAFGGAGSMNVAHMLFHQDSRHLLSFLRSEHGDRRERSLVLCTALMRSAGLDFNEQGDVWARVAEQRARQAGRSPDPRAWSSFIGDVCYLLLGEARADLIGGDWLFAFEDAGRALRTLREDGDLTRGIRAVIATHVIFHWNRWGLPAITQGTLARAATEAVFGGTTD